MVRKVLQYCSTLHLCTLAFVLFLSLVWPFAYAASKIGCEPDRVDETVQVAQIYDGDTVKLADGRRVRLIGLNTPELGQDGEPDQALASEGRSSLEKLLGSQPRVNLRFDSQRRDKYGRILAHIYGGHSNDSLTAAMLRRGAGALIVVPPNVWNWECYAAAEAAARKARVGVWALPEYQPRPAANLPSKINGYAIVHGRVARIGRSRDAVWINFSDSRFAVRIRRADLKYFDETDFDRWSGRILQARGWVRPGKNDRLAMDIRHPAALEFDP